MLAERSILNIDRFKSDIKDRMVDRNVTLTSPYISNVNVNVKPVNFEHLTNEILKIAKVFPHRACVLTYHINEQSNIEIKVCPVTETA